MKKAFYRFFICLVTSTLVVSEVLLADIGDWKTIASMLEIRDTTIRGDVVWAATAGGVLKYNTSTGEVTQITNTEGLSSNNVTAIGIDQHENIWVGFNNGLMNVFKTATTTWEIIDDYDGQQINAIVPYGDSVFIALDIGVSLYETIPNHVKETYTSLGTNLPVEIPVYAISFYGRDIWVGTGYGFARSNLDLTNLMDPESWQNYNRFVNSTAEKIFCFLLTDSIFFAGTNDGILQFDGTTWAKAVLSKSNVYRLRYLNNTIYAVVESAVYSYHPGEDVRRVGNSISKTTTLEINSQGKLWVGSGSSGLHSYNSAANTWNQVDLNTPGGNLFADIALDDRGTLWCASYGSGIFVFDGNKWMNFSKDNGLNFNHFRAVVIDNDGRAWFGAEGKGITIIEKIADQFQITVIDSADGRITGSSNPDYIIIEDLTIDGKGNIWIANRLADNFQALAVRTPDDKWAHFSVTDGLKSHWVSTIFVDRYDRVWVGTSDKGFSVLDYNQTLFDKSDDNWDLEFDIEDQLESNQVSAIAEDNDEVIWIGSAEGLNFWFQGQLGVQYNLINSDINEVNIDVRNNKWIGTKGGLSVLASDGFTWNHYTMSTSPIVSDNVLSIDFDENTGKVYVGTDKGLSIFETPFTRPEANLSQVKGYPNPFIIGSGLEIFTIENLIEESSIRIITESGLMVRNIPQQEIPGSRARWDGRNDRGELVASGIYLYLVYSENGQTATGKVAVIRQ